MENVRLARAAPHVAVGSLVLAASAARLAADITGQEAEVATWTAATAFTVAVVAATVARRRVFSVKALRRVYAFLGVAAGWLTTVTVTGLSLGAVGVLMAVGYALSLSWWRANPVPMMGARGPVEVQRVSDFVRLWRENVAVTDGALPGTSLTDEEAIKAGSRFVLRLKPGKQTLGMVNGVLDRLRSGLLLRPGQELIVETHPEMDEACLLLTVVTRSPIKEAVIHPGASAFNSVTGRIALGPFVDGEGTATWRAYEDNRLWGGFIQGGTGSGKSRMIESIALSLAASSTHPTVIMYGDGQGGASSPLLMRHADVQARTHEQILAMAEGMNLVMSIRQLENAAEEAEGFTPAIDRPGILGIIDECHKPLNSQENQDGWERLQYLLATIAREGGKVGVALLLASQQATLDVFGGAGTKNSEAIRTNVLAGNGVMLRGKDPNAKSIFGVDVNPKKFPPLAGYGFLVDEDPSGRSAPFRGYYVTDSIRREWPGQIQWRELDPAASAEWGKEYRDRRELAKSSMDDVRRQLARRRAGIAAEKPKVAEPAKPEASAAFPVWKPPANLHEGHAKVLGALGNGHASPSRISESVGLSVRQVHNLLDELMGAGKVGKAGHGRYEVKEAA